MPELLVRFRPYCAGMLASFTLTAALFAAIFTWMDEPEFEVRARILVQPGSGKGAEKALTLLRSGAAAEQVLAAVGAERLLPNEALQARLKLRPGRDPRAVEMHFRHPQAAAAAQTVDTLISLFRIQLQKNQYPQTARLQEQIFLAQQQVRSAERKLFLFGRQSQPSSAQDVDRLRQELKAEEEKLQAQAAALTDLERQYAAGPDDGRTELLRLKLYERELLRKYEEQEPLVAEVRQQINIVREQLRQSGAADVDGLERRAEQIIHAKEAWRSQQEAEAAARKRLAQFETKQQVLAGQEEAFQRMQAELAERKERAARLLTEFEADRQRAEAGSAVTVLEPPLPPLKPVRPHMLRSLLAAAIFGLVGSLLHAVLRSRRRNG